MVARANRKSVDKAQAEKYRRVGAALLESATVLSELATDADSFGNAIAVVAVHACIAYNDALSIAWKGVKSTEGDHARAADTLVFALGHLAAAEQVRRLGTVLSHKDPGLVPGQLLPGERGGAAAGAGGGILRVGGAHLRPPPGPLIPSRMKLWRGVRRTQGHQP